jgi:amino acid transporter/mannitol/fructose-specific phosphotransferase system IIA component (Ntr-type)
VSGIGTWLLLILKSAFALAGLGAYLNLIAPLAPGNSLYVAAGIGLFLVGLNAVGVKKSGQLQSFLVLVSLLVLMVFAQKGSVRVDRGNFEPFVFDGTYGFLAATAFLFVSYAGITKIASAAEEIKNPDRNIPLGMILSLVVMILLYTIVAYVYVGIVPAEEYGKKAGMIYADAPIAQAALRIGGELTQFGISLVAVLALTSMANAGLLASSRYPMAMARHDQLPDPFAQLHPYTGTPLLAVGVTGAIMIGSLLLLPVVQLAKLASGFLLLLFAVLNLSVVIFRESEIELYKPSFRAPGYPYLQFVGVLFSLALLPFLGILTLVGSVGLCLVGGGWYLLYVSSSVDRRSTVGRTSVRDHDRKVLQSREKKLLTETHRDRVVLIPFFNLDETELLEAQQRIETVTALFEDNYTFKVLHLREVADRYFLNDEFEPSEVDRLLERFVQRINRSGRRRLTYDALSTAQSRGFVRHFCEEQPVAFTVIGWKSNPRWKFLVPRSEWWLGDFPSELLMIKNPGPTQFEDVKVLSSAFPDGSQTLGIRSGGEFARQQSVSLDVYLRGLTPEADESTILFDRFNQYFKDLLDGGRNLRRLRVLSESDTSVFEEESLTVVGSGFNANGLNDLLESSTTLIRPLVAGSTPRDNSRRSTSVQSLLGSDSIHLGTSKPLTKRALFHEVAGSFNKDEGVSTYEVERALWTTESAYSTYRRPGYALPHGIVSGAQRAVKVFRLERPVSYTVGEDEVTLCVAVIGSEDRASEVLERISELDELLAREAIRSELLDARSVEDFLKVLRGPSRATVT